MSELGSDVKVGCKFKIDYNFIRLLYMVLSLSIVMKFVDKWREFYYIKYELYNKIDIQKVDKYIEMIKNHVKKFETD